MAAIELYNLSKSFQGSDGQQIHALDDISLSLNAHDFLAIVGPSGSGKTTLLRIIAGLEQPTSGCIQIHGQSAASLPPGQRDIAMVFQEPALYPHLTVRQNIEFPLKLRKAPPALIRQRLENAAATLGLESYLDRLPSELSGGQQQRVALGRAMVRQPQAFLLDEPLSNLDAPAREELRTMIAHIHDETGAPMVYVTHDQSEAMSFPGNLAVMHQGRIEQIDHPLDVYLHPCNIFTAQFLGTPSMNLFAGHLDQAGGQSVFRCSDPRPDSTSATLRLPVRPSFSDDFSTNDSVTIGIRPEDVVWQKEPSTDPFVELPLKVNAVSLRGEKAVVSANFNGHPFHAIIPIRQFNQPRNNKTAFVAMDHIYFFDSRTTRRLSPERHSAP